MARGDLRAVVCTSTLDLGIDWGAVDLVIQLAAPKGSSRLVQRIGRANHRLDEPSPAHSSCPRTASRRWSARRRWRRWPPTTSTASPTASARRTSWPSTSWAAPAASRSLADDLYAEVISSSAPFADLTREDFDRVLQFVSNGGYALQTYDRFRRIVQGPLTVAGRCATRTPPSATA